MAALVLAVYYYQRGPGLEREVDRLASLVDLRSTMTVAEIGTGKGRMAVRLARRLGPSGRLYATELETWKLDAVRNAAASGGVANITAILAGEHSTGLPDACCDIIYMRRVYHHFADPASMGRSLHAALRPNGRLAVIDFLSPRWMPFLRHGIPSNTLVEQVTGAGFTLERRIDGWSPIDYCLVFRQLPSFSATPAARP
jgi:ubiquinone/menaquinone biosynthesis C-methylase UbiE